MMRGCKGRQGCKKQEGARNNRGTRETMGVYDTTAPSSAHRIHVDDLARWDFTNGWNSRGPTENG
jgi:hypothetical protein